jgi:hypothetical protein
MIKLNISPTTFTSFVLEGQRKDVRWKDDGKKNKMKEKRLGTTHKDKFKRICFTFFTFATTF